MFESAPIITINSYLVLVSLGLLLFGGLIGWFLGRYKQGLEIERLRSQLQQEQELSRYKIDSLEQSFNELSSSALERNNRLFLELAQQSLSRFHVQAKGELDLKEKALEGLVKPIRQALDHTHEQIEKLERDRRETHGMLTKHLESLAETQRVLHGETRNLVKALRRPEVRGQWGELTLKRLVELAGMVEHCDFSEQVQVDGGNQNLRPDMVVHMPAGRQVVVDVKTPLDAYLNAIEANDDEQRKTYLQQHSKTVRERIKELANKRYWEQFQNAPEFIILFIPGDQFLSAALDEDQTLLENSLKQKVILATPTSFVALLRAIAYGWRQESLSRNAEKIRKVGEDFYQRLNTLTEHLSKLGRALDSSVNQFNNVVGSFEKKVIPGARKFQELGVHSTQFSETPEPIERQTRILTEN